MAVALLGAVALLLSVGSARADVYWGAAIHGESYGETEAAPINETAWDLFERHAGKKVAILNMGQRWVTFNPVTMSAAHARGAIPMVTMGLGSEVTLTEVVNGAEDADIRAWARAARDWGHPFLLGPWWEMNGFWYHWGQDPNFVAAWRHFHDLVVAEGATNVTWTWVSNSIYDEASDPLPYYPGDAYVDWVGIDSYNWGENPAQPDRWLNPDQTLTRTLRRVREIAPSRPVIIVENASSEIGGNKTEWIEEMLGSYLPHHPEIGAYLWFNWNFPKGSLRADWPIESSAPAQQAFHSGIQSSFFRLAPALPDLTKVPPPPSAPPAGPPLAKDLSPAGQTALTPQLAVAPDGATTVVWSGRSGSEFAIFSRRIGPGGTPAGTINRLSAAGGDAFSPDIDIADDGTVTVVWVRWDGANFIVQARRIAPNGSVGSETRTLSGPSKDAATPQVASDEDGASTVVWKRFDGFHFLVQERRIAPDGTVPGSVNILSEPHQDSVAPRVEVGPDGTAIVVWSRFDGSNTVVQARGVSPAGAPLEVPHDLSSTGADAVRPRLAMAADGGAAAVWTRFDGENWIVQYRRLQPGGVPVGAAGDLSAAGRSAAEPDISMTPNGQATVVWDRFDGASFVVQARRVSSTGSPQTVKDLSAPGGDAAEPMVDVGPDGSASVVWARFNGDHLVAQKRRLAADGTPAAVIDLYSAGGASGPAVAIGPNLTEALAWKRFDNGGDVVQGLSSPGLLATLEPATHDFGSVEVGSAQSKTFTVRNAGGSPFSISSLSVSGADASSFLLSDASACLGQPIAPGASCQFTISFKPFEAGPRHVALQVKSNAATIPEVLDISGTGAPGPGTPGKPATSAPQTAKVGGAIDNRFKVGKPILDRKKGTAKLPVTVPGAGVLTLDGAGRTVRALDAEGTVALRIAAKGRKKRKLLQTGAVVMKLKVTFAPRGGAAKSQSLSLTLKKDVPRR